MEDYGITPNYSFSDFIVVFENSLEKEFCEKCIEKFKTDENKYQGIVGSGIKLDTKRSTDLQISGSPEWEEEDRVFFESLNKGIQEYVEKFSKLTLQSVSHAFKDSGYQIQETKPGDYYIWHDDFSCTNNDSAPRYLTYLWYLNDIHEDGYTEFLDGTKIQPEVGKLLIFPATWTYVHRGFPPKSEVKYICTGWVHTTDIP